MAKAKPDLSSSSETSLTVNQKLWMKKDIYDRKALAG